MALTIPAGVNAEGMVKIVWTPTQSLSVAILTGATSVDLSCYLIKDSFGYDAATEKGTDERVCSKEVYETLGKTTWSFEDLLYVWSPQATTGSADNKAYETLKFNTPGYLTVRWGKDVEADFAVGDVVDQFPITVGQQVPQKPEANSKLKVKQSISVTGPANRDAKLIA